jgi:hypothetical protein
MLTFFVLNEIKGIQKNIVNSPKFSHYYNLSSQLQTLLFYSK